MNLCAWDRQYSWFVEPCGWLVCNCLLPCLLATEVEQKHQSGVRGSLCLGGDPKAKTSFF